MARLGPQDRQRIEGLLRAQWAESGRVNLKQLAEAEGLNRKTVRAIWKGKKGVGGLLEQLQKQTRKSVSGDQTTEAGAAYDDAVRQAAEEAALVRTVRNSGNALMAVLAQAYPGATELAKDITTAAKDPSSVLKKDARAAMNVLRDFTAAVRATAGVLRAAQAMERDRLGAPQVVADPLAVDVNDDMPPDELRRELIASIHALDRAQGGEAAGFEFSTDAGQVPIPPAPDTAIEGAKLDAEGPAQERALAAGLRVRVFDGGRTAQTLEELAASARGGSPGAPLEGNPAPEPEPAPVETRARAGWTHVR